MKTAHEAWETMRKQCQGTTKVRAVRIQALRQEFETLQMEDAEGMQDYLTRVAVAANQVRALDHTLAESEVVSKVLRSLAPKFDFVVVAIEESKEVSKLNLDDLSGTLLAHEVRVNRMQAKGEEKALVVKGDTFDASSSKGGSSGNSWGDGRGRGHSFTRGRGRARGGRGRGIENKSQVQCFHCKKFGHVKANCWAKEKQPEKEASMVAEEKGSSNVFMVSQAIDFGSSSVWLIDSGCSNHMIGDMSLFVNLDESQKVSVRLGNDKEILVEGVGTVCIHSKSGEQKILQGVQFVPGLAHNLLSVGQLLSKGYSVMFNQESCVITDNHTKKLVIEIQKSRNNMFPVDVLCIGRLNVVVSDQISSKLWHS